MMSSRRLPNIGSFPTDPIEIECKECGRRGRYSKAALIEQYGDLPRIPLGHCRLSHRRILHVMR